MAYTRNGQFDVDKDGFIVNAQGYQLTGYGANAAGVILPASPTAMQIDTADPSPTSLRRSTSASISIRAPRCSAQVPRPSMKPIRPPTVPRPGVGVFDTWATPT